MCLEEKSQICNKTLNFYKIPNNIGTYLLNLTCICIYLLIII